MSDTSIANPAIQDNDALLWGVSAIAHEIRRGRNATRRLLEHGDLPGRRIGDRWVAPRDRLRRALGVEPS
jgi:hypothetical protein